MSNHVTNKSAQIQAGSKIGMLTVERLADKQVGWGDIWLCKCDCGNYRETSDRNLRRNPKINCGCTGRKISTRSKEKHGMRWTQEYVAWQHMLRRCYNKKCRQYKDWGGRGIIVCDEWKVSFLSFFEHVGLKPSPELSLERINNDKNYEPGNVKWGTAEEQRNNQRRSFKVIFRDIEDTPARIAKMVGLHRNTLALRKRKKWSWVELFSTPNGYLRGVYDLPIDELRRMNEYYTSRGMQFVKRHWLDPRKSVEELRQDGWCFDEETNQIARGGFYPDEEKGRRVKCPHCEYYFVPHEPDYDMPPHKKRKYNHA